MNKLIIVGMGLSLIIPAQLHSLSKQKVKATAKIIIGCASSIGASIILLNIAKAAQRRLANPDYQGSKSYGALLNQTTSILWHNKPLATYIAFALSISGTCIYFIIQDLKSDAPEIQN